MHVLAVAACASMAALAACAEDEDLAEKRIFGAAPAADAGAGLGTKRVICNDRVHAASSEGRRITLAAYQRAIADVFDGTVVGSAKFPGTYGKSATGYSTEAAINGLGEQDVAQIQVAAEEVALGVAGALPKLLPCAAAAADEACVGVFLDKYARRAYRRALSAEEKAQLLATFRTGLTSPGATFTDGVALVVAHMLQTPQFLYVMEDAAPAARRLTGEELASRLSFLLWDSVPDDALLAAATSGALSDATKVLEQAKRMLASDKANTAIARLFREWTGASQLAPANKDAVTYPSFDAALARSMNESFDRFAVGQLRGDGTLTSLLKSSEAYVDATMATFYGVTAPPAGQWAKVTLDPTRYSGLSTQAAVLASLAHPADASFVLRGKFVITRLLCGSLGEAPANALSVFGSLPTPPQPTGKDVSATLLSEPGCASCHKTINPPGLAFEHFDGVGRYRERYGSGKAIDTSGTLSGLVPQPIQFQGPSELMDALAKEPQAAVCFATQLFRFAMSRRETPDDQCALQALGDALAASDGKLAETLLALTTTDAFTHRIEP